MVLIIVAWRELKMFAIIAFACKSFRCHPIVKKMNNLTILPPAQELLMRVMWVERQPPAPCSQPPTPRQTCWSPAHQSPHLETHVDHQPPHLEPHVTYHPTLKHTLLTIHTPMNKSCKKCPAWMFGLWHLTLLRDICLWQTPGKLCPHLLLNRGDPAPFFPISLPCPTLLARSAILASPPQAPREQEIPFHLPSLFPSQEKVSQHVLVFSFLPQNKLIPCLYLQKTS